MDEFLPKSLRLNSDIYPGYLFVLDQNAIVILDVSMMNGADPYVALLSSIADIAIEANTPSAIELGLGYIIVVNTEFSYIRKWDISDINNPIYLETFPTYDFEINST